MLELVSTSEPTRPTLSLNMSTTSGPMRSSPPLVPRPTSLARHGGVGRGSGDMASEVQDQLPAPGYSDPQCQQAGQPSAHARGGLDPASGDACASGLSVWPPAPLVVHRPDCCACSSR